MVECAALALMPEFNCFQNKDGILGVTMKGTQCMGREQEIKAGGERSEGTDNKHHEQGRSQCRGNEK